MYEAVWHSKSGDHIVTVTGYLGKGSDGRNYASILNSPTGIPLDELSYIDPDDPSPYQGFWVDCHGRLHITE